MLISLQTVKMTVDNCVKFLKISGAMNASAQNEAVCMTQKTSQDLSGQLDTRGSPMQLGNHPLDGSDDGGNFSGCLKNLRINGQVNCFY